MLGAVTEAFANADSPCGIITPSRTGHFRLPAAN